MKYLWAVLNTLSIHYYMSLTFSTSIACGHAAFNGESTVLKYFQGDRHIPHPLAFRHIISGMTEPYRNLIFYANSQWRYGDSPIYVAAQCTQWPSQQDK